MTETLKKLFTKQHYKRLEDTDKYQKPVEEAKKVIDKASAKTRLKLEITESHTYQVVDAFAIESREDMIEAFTKKPDE